MLHCFPSLVGVLQAPHSIIKYPLRHALLHCMPFVWSLRSMSSCAVLRPWNLPKLKKYWLQSLACSNPPFPWACGANLFLPAFFHHFPLIFNHIKFLFSTRQNTTLEWDPGDSKSGASSLVPLSKTGWFSNSPHDLSVVLSDYPFNRWVCLPPYPHSPVDSLF